MLIAAGSAIGIILALYLAVLALAYWRQESLLFAPAPLPQDHDFALPADVEELRIAVDGATLSALHLALPRPAGVVFFLHGNAGNLADWFVNLELYRRINYDLFMIDYRGFGKSTGRISSQVQLQADVALAWQAMLGRYASQPGSPHQSLQGSRFAGLRKVIYGRSLGTDLAAALAAQVRPDLTILVSPYWSMAEIARQQYPMLPIGLLRYPLETFREVARLGQQMSEGRGEGRGQLLLVHGERDALIPLSHSQRLQALAPGSQLVVIAGAGHGDLQDFPAYQNALADAIAGKDNGSSADSAADPGNDAGSADLSAGKPSTARRRSPGT